MKRLLLDTNIYGELIFDADLDNLKDKIKEGCVIHGFDIVRKELRNTPKESHQFGKNVRLSLLFLYDDLIKKSYSITEDMNELSYLYYTTYRTLGGSKSFDDLKNDFCVVACATIHQIDIVVSEDNKTMLVENALKAYDIVNSSRKVKTPEFIGYLKFKRWLHE